MPGSLNTVVQFLGRAMRVNTDDYPAEHREPIGRQESMPEVMRRPNKKDARISIPGNDNTSQN